MSFVIDVPSAAARFNCAPNDTLLQAALRSGVSMPYECNSGGCGACKFDLVKGGVIDAWPDAPGRSASDRVRGRRLACQSIPSSDCVIKVRLDTKCKPRVQPEVIELRLLRSRVIATDLRELTFESDHVANFLAGQFAMLKLGDLRRAYSMSNTPNSIGHWQFIVRRTETGLMSAALFDLKAGAAVILDGPYGLASLRSNSSRDIVCVGGGSGLAPLLSILKGAQVSGNRGRTSSLFYGARSEAHLPDVAQLLGEESGPPFRYWPVLSVKNPGSPGGHLEGFVHDHVFSLLMKPAPELDFYLAGPPPMIEACLRLLVMEHGVPQSQVIYDRFF